MPNKCKLINGECIKEMNNIKDKSIDLICCDLPYSMTKMNWDCLIPFNELWEQYDRIIKDDGNIVLFSSGGFTIDLINSNRKLYKYKLIWKKNVPTGMSSAKYRPMNYYEEICIFNKGKAVYNPQMKPRVGEHKECYNYEHYCGESNHVNYKKEKYRYDPDWVQPSNILEFNVVPNRNGKLHPTQKPVDLCEWLIKTYSNVGDIVLDNCMGSGTTGVACINLDRNFIGIELDSGYFEIAKKRIAKVDMRRKNNGS